MLKKILATILAICLLAGPAFADGYTERQEVQKFMDDFAKKHPNYPLNVKDILQHGKRQQSILDAISRPAERVLNWGQYRNIFLEPKRLAQGVEFWQQHRDVVERVAEKYQVEPEIILAILGVETRYGRLVGNYRVLDALLTLGFDYSPRAKFFASELEQFLLLLAEQDFDPQAIKGSYAGAMGYGQFISSSYRHYAVDGDADGKVDILNNVADALASVANYFVKHGWRYGEPVMACLPKQTIDKSLLSAMPRPQKPHITIAELRAKGVRIPKQYEASQLVTLMALESSKGIEHCLGFENFYVISRYNHSHLYSMAVYQFSQLLRLHVEMP